jgi:site-specific DNA-adenine methylase
LSYSDIDPKSFEPNSIVYLDPPYESTADYLNRINHKELYEWVSKIEVPVYISSYKSPLKPVMALNHRTTLHGGKTKKESKRVEWLFWNEKD